MDRAIRHLINGAHSAAELSGMHPRVGCLLVGTSGKAAGFNVPKSHPLQAMWAKRVGRHHRIFLHAEFAALIAYLRAFDDTPHTAVVVRLGKLGEFRPSFPCPVCYPCLLHAGVREIIYFNKDGTFHRFDCLTQASVSIGE